MWSEIIHLIKNHQSFVLSSHVNPDGDAIGSELALAGHLLRLGKQVTILNSDPLPVNFRFLDPRRMVRRFSPVRHTPVIQTAEVIFVLDTSGGWSRLGSVGEALAAAGAVKACIDHHPDPTDFVDLAVVDTDAAATGELIYELLKEMGAELSLTMAHALYTAIVTDTGSFRFPKTSPRTHRITADLLAAGVDSFFVYRQIYEQHALNRIRLKGQVMASIQTTAGGQIAYYSLAGSILKACGVAVSDLDGFASLGQEIGGVRIVIFCLESSRSRVKVSLRSDGTVAINRLAAEYGGGGHPAAAGATVTGRPMEEVLVEVVAKATALLTDS